MDMWEVAARTAIAHLMSTYAYKGDQGDVDGFVATFAPGAIYEPMAGWVCRNEADIRAFLNDLVGKLRAHKEKTGEVIRLRHNLTTSFIEFDSPTEAHGRTHFFAMTSVGVDHAGHYEDGFVLREGRWLFSRRKVLTLWFDERSHVPAVVGT